ncbi:hypothetical protein B0J12DRAFT_745922 [Macrophomina phaseolina]|uniref:Uncharacterized protein n=1 Tax=Macrophomina phaseolina TaxID=35725 RepID=A0ABQ8FUF8_9PEZI|nr:hypothetical protein B0J12DRAFT_745922 [Macrophomina phaseolina]
MTTPAANDDDDDDDDVDDDEEDEGQGTPFPAPGPAAYPAQPPPQPFHRTPSPPTQMLSSSPPTISPFRTPSPRTLAAHPPSPTHLAIALLKPSSTSTGAHPAITLTLSTHRAALPTDDADTAIPAPWTPATAKAALQATLARITRIFESYGVTRQEKRGPADVRGYYRMHSMSAWREYHGARNEDDGVVPTAWARCEVEVGFASCAAMMAVVGAVLGEGGRAGEGWRAKGFEGEFCDGQWEAEEERRRVGEETLEVLRGWHGVEVEYAGDDR